MTQFRERAGPRCVPPRSDRAQIQRRRSLRIATRPRPASSNAHVDGSGTGVKLSTRLAPEVEKLKVPPLSADAKFAVFTASAAVLKPTKLVADAIDHE